MIELHAKNLAPPDAGRFHSTRSTGPVVVLRVREIRDTAPRRVRILPHCFRAFQVHSADDLTIESGADFVEIIEYVPQIASE